MQTEYCSCVYHSERWGELVEQGWVTMFVTGSMASMIRQDLTRRPVFY